ncbi:FG-nucleoporin NUP116 [Sugiyamaella lignohabitans]|uniref:FG-nucleoporin NUP116 n=1 Tax=Sugiyamaella lignohabitans TaxID=796027 RepID=A0A167C4E3_9ASCO|nr:FG-nucleoporin NUP116 [Sugiyamaella lignohabitans]ANB11202.1 FG-nucleoporin NUP116 [Sugiyamaella lignohabitans]
MFGNTNRVGGFGTSNTTNTTGSGGLFGSSPSTGAFGSSTTGQATSPFGQAASSTGGTGLFGQTTNNSGGGLFGSSTSGQTSNVFGSANSANNASSTSPFGQANTGASGGLFGATKPTTGFGGFSNTATNSSPFGQSTAATSFGSSANNNQNQGTSVVPFEPFSEKDTTKANMSNYYQSITSMPQYQNFSFEVSIRYYIYNGPIIELVLRIYSLKLHKFNHRYGNHKIVQLNCGPTSCFQLTVNGLNGQKISSKFDSLLTHKGIEVSGLSTKSSLWKRWC